MRKSPLSPNRGAGRRGGPSFLLIPSELLASQTVLSPEESKKRVANLALFSSVENLNEADELDVATPRGLSKQEMRLLRETHEVTKTSTPQKDFEAFLADRLERGDFISKMTDEEFKARYEMGALLGDGASSTVVVGKLRSTGEEVAIKTVPAKECAILQKIRHPNIVGMKEGVLTENNLYIVMEFVHGLSLFDHILQVRTYAEQDARNTIKCLLGAVCYLHENGIAHRDLKPENIIVSDGAEGEALLKIVDFGGSGIVLLDHGEEEEGLTTPTGCTPGYRAPEMLSAQYGRAVDVWSVGVITYILLCGFPPFFSSRKDINMDYLSNAPFWIFINKDSPELRDELLEGKVEFPSPFFDEISSAAKEFVRSLLIVQDEKRLTAKMALEHVWMTCDLSGAGEQQHILFDRLHSSPGLLDSAALPPVTRARMNELRRALEQRLAARPRIAELKRSGIYQSRENIL